MLSSYNFFLLFLHHHHHLLLLHLVLPHPHRPGTDGQNGYQLICRTLLNRRILQIWLVMPGASSIRRRAKGKQKIKIMMIVLSCPTLPALVPSELQQASSGLLPWAWPWPWDRQWQAFSSTPSWVSEWSLAVVAPLDAQAAWPCTSLTYLLEGSMLPSTLLPKYVWSCGTINLDGP